MNDLKFDITVEIQEVEYLHKKGEEPKWMVSFHIPDCHIHNKEFFIDGYHIVKYVEEKKPYEMQVVRFNDLLKKKIERLLLPKSKAHYFNVSRNVAWDYYHYTSYLGFRFNVHPCSMGHNFLRQTFTGTQEEIYNKCLELNQKWISKNKEL